MALWLHPIDRIRTLEDNNLCADCNTGSPTHYSLKYGVLLCPDCGAIHEDICKGDNPVLPLECLSSQKEVSIMLEFGGNKAVNNQLEKFLPSSYRKSFAQLNPFIKRQYIKKKYISKGFELEESGKLTNERKVGILSKKSVEADSEWKLQYVVLDRERKVLECFKKGGVFDPEESIPLASAEVFIEEVDGHEGWKQCIKVSWERRKSGEKKKSPVECLRDDAQSMVKKNTVMRSKGKDIKHIFLASGREDELFEWLSAILATQEDIPRSKEVVHIPTPHPVRLAKSRSTPALNKIDSKFSVLPATLGVSAAPIFLKTGKLWKTGPDKMDSWRERWFTLHNNHIIYSRGKLSTQASGEFSLGATLEGYRVEKGHSKHTRIPPHEHTLTITTPGRTYTLCAESAEARDEWVEAVNKVIHHNNSTVMLRARDFNTVIGEGGLRKANSTVNVHVLS